MTDFASGGHQRDPWESSDPEQQWKQLLDRYFNRPFCSLPLVPDDKWHTTALHYPLLRPQTIAAVIFLTSIGLLILVGCIVVLFCTDNGVSHHLFILGIALIVAGISPLFSVRRISVNDAGDQIVLTRGFGPRIRTYRLRRTDFRLQLTVRNDLADLHGVNQTCLELVHADSGQSIVLAADKRPEILSVSQALADILRVPWEDLSPGPVQLPDGRLLPVSRDPMPVRGTYCSRRKIVFHNQKAVVRQNVVERVALLLLLFFLAFLILTVVFIAEPLDESVTRILLPGLVVAMTTSVILMVWVLLRRRLVMNLSRGTLSGRFTRKQGSDGRTVIPLSEIAAVQVCYNRELEHTGTHFVPVDVYQLNLVLHTPPGSRRHLICSVKPERALADAQQLVKFLNVPLLDHVPPEFAPWSDD